METGIINIRGKQYQSVALRVQKFRETHPNWPLLTEIISRDDESVVVAARIVDDCGITLATGHAEEYRRASQINKTSALENAETSAIGRALAALGFGGTEFATANEVQNAIHQQVNGGRDEAESQVGPPPTEPAKWTEPGSIYSGIHKLKQGLRKHQHDLEGCGDSTMIYALCNTDEWREFCRVAELHAPWYLRGGDPAPPEFEGLLIQAERMVKEFDTAEANQRTAYAGT